MELVRRRVERDGPVRDDRRAALHLPGIVEQRGPGHKLGSRLVWDGTATAPPSAGVVRGIEGFVREADVVEGIVRHDAPGGIAGSLQDFLNALQTGETPMGECHDNIKSLAMVFAAIESSATGRRVPVSG